MRYLLDTNTVNYALRGIGNVNEKLRLISPVSVTISSITEAELWHWVENRRSQKLKRVITAFLQPLDIIHIDSQSARNHSKLVTILQHRGEPVNMVDTMIAAIGITRKMVVVTNNTKHFKGIKGLKVEDWI